MASRSGSYVSTPARRPRRLARTVARARWPEYRELLETAIDEGYTALALEDWLTSASRPDRVLVLRHDVDQAARTVLPMLRIEQELGLTSTWYFRWRTADAAVIDAVRDAGGQVGLHYETLTRLALARGLTAADVDAELVAEARQILRAEITAFRRRFGELRSVCPHGDTRAPGVLNRSLLEDEDWTRYGVELDGNAATKREKLGLWLTDRTAAAGRWKDGTDPLAVLREHVTPVMCLTHPNNWCSGTELWRDRAATRARASLSSTSAGAGLRTDVPPLVLADAARKGHAGRDFAPVAQDLRRELARLTYDRGGSFTDPGRRASLETNSSLLEARATLVERAVEEAGELPSLAGRRVLDLGCGIGAIGLLLAVRGADVVGVDPDANRIRIAQRLAVRHGLSARYETGLMEELTGHAGYDVVLLNNCFAFVTRRRARREALRRATGALAPGGVLFIREPNRWTPADGFSGVPGINLLPFWLVRRLRFVPRLRRRSIVRIVTPLGLARELRRAGLVEVRRIRRDGEGALRMRLGGHFQLTGRRPVT